MNALLILSFAIVFLIAMPLAFFRWSNHALRNAEKRKIAIQNAIALLNASEEIHFRYRRYSLFLFGFVFIFLSLPALLSFRTIAQINFQSSLIVLVGLTMLIIGLKNFQLLFTASPALTVTDQSLIYKGKTLYWSELESIKFNYFRGASSLIFVLKNKGKKLLWFSYPDTLKISTTSIKDLDILLACIDHLKKTAII